MSEEQIARLLGGPVTARDSAGETIAGVLVGYCDKPSVIIQDLDERRTSYAVSALHDLRRDETQWTMRRNGLRWQWTARQGRMQHTGRRLRKKAALREVREAVASLQALH